MSRLGPVLAVAGLVLAAVLFAREDIGGIAALLLASGPGLVVAGLFHVVPMAANARAWQVLLPRARPGIIVMTWAIWIRESVNGLLPVARVGGEIVAYRLLRRRVGSRPDLAASLIADMGLSMLSQAGFALLGLGFLMRIGHSSAAITDLLVATGCMIALGIAFIFAQRGGVLSAMTRLTDPLLKGRFGSASAGSERLDAALAALYQRRREVMACFAWQLGGWMLGAGEIGLALHFLGRSPSVFDALVIEALIQAISSAAFVVPGALGVQEGGFVLIGAALGIDGTTGLALAAARRLRDLVIFFPGLIAWQWDETRTRKLKLHRAGHAR